MNTTTPFPILTRALAYQLIEPARLNKFFAPFSDELAAGGISFPDHESANGSYYDSINGALASPDQLPAPLRNALLTLEKAAAPDNANRLDDAIQRRIRCVNLHNRCSIDCALELWFRAPDELSPFAPPESCSASASASASASPPLPSTAPVGPLPPAGAPESSLILDPDQDQKSQIEIQKSVGLQPSTCNFQPPSSPTDTESFQRLALLSPAEYDRARRAEAKRLDLRIETLDTEVAKCRAELNHQAALQSALGTLHSPEPWPEPVCGAEALDQVSSRYSLYLVLPPGAADAMSLWTTHTHALAAFHLSPRLSLYSPKPGCGKTTAFDVLTTMLPRPLRTENISPAVLFRLVDQHQPALLLDEVDAYLPQSEELRGLLNAGHKRGACAYRCEGEGKAVRAFRAFAPAALAGIGSLPATLRDRSVLIPLVPAEEGQIAARFDPLRTDIEKTLARKLARWAADNFDALAACDPPLPPGAFNRLADNWRPLLAVAQIAGGDWPARALAAFTKLAAPLPSIGSAKEGPPSRPTLDIRHKTLDFSESVTLLASIRQVFAESGTTRLSSNQLLAALLARPDCPSDSPFRIPRSAHRSLARALRPFGISPRAMRIGTIRAKGYAEEDFQDAFRRYIPNSKLEAVLAAAQKPAPSAANSIPQLITPNSDEIGSGFIGGPSLDRRKSLLGPSGTV